MPVNPGSFTQKQGSFAKLARHSYQQEQVWADENQLRHVCVVGGMPTGTPTGTLKAAPLLTWVVYNVTPTGTPTQTPASMCD